MTEELKPQENQAVSSEAPTGSVAAAPGGSAATEEPAALPLETAEEQLAEALAKIAELQDQCLRALAEAENTRRRADDEIAKARKFAVESFAESIVPVKDSLEMALNLDHPDVDKLREGVEATLRQLASALERNRVTEISPAAGSKFDPHRHQAISMVPADQEANTVVSVLQKGYAIADRVLRPALVTVASAK